MEPRQDYFLNFFSSLRGKIILLLIAFVGTQVVLTLTAVYFGKKNQALMEKLTQVYYPMLEIPHHLNASINGVIIAQRGYIITKQKSFEQSREDTWKKVIFFNLKKIDTLIQKDNNPEIKARLKKLNDDFVRYKQIQEEINQLLNKSLEINNKKIKNDTIHQQWARSKMIDGKIIKDLLPLSREIKSVINEFQNYTKERIEGSLSQVNKNRQMTSLSISILTLLMLLLMVLVLFDFQSTIKKFVRRIKENLYALSQGKIVQQETDQISELKDIYQATQLLSDNLKKAGEFANNVGDEKFDTSFEPASKEDLLGNALLLMRDKLIQAAAEEEKRSWTTRGLAKFNDLINRNTQDLKALGDLFLEELILYTGTVQGGIFVLNDSDSQQEAQSLEMVSCYAFDRKKYIEKKLEIHKDYADSLVGQVYLEAQPILINQIPENYLKISSGLGEAMPGYLFICPIKNSNKSEGVLELASFKPFEPFQTEFIEKVCENLSVAIVGTKNNERTKKLVEILTEQSEAMQAQEEELRQNLEELQTTQEAMHRKQKEIEVANQKMKNNEEVLKKSLKDLKEKDEQTKKLIAESQKIEEQLRELEQKNREQEKNFLDVIYASSDPVLLIESGRFVDCNEAAVQILGAQNKAQVLNITPDQISPEIQPDQKRSDLKAQEMIQMALQKGMNRFEWMHKKITGEEFLVEVTLFFILFQGKEIIYTSWKDFSRQNSKIFSNSQNQELLH